MTPEEKQKKHEEVKKQQRMNTMLNRRYFTKFSDGSVRAIPMSTIMLHHATVNAPDDPVTFMEEETVPLFLANPAAIEDWAKNNMDWSDVASEAVVITPASLNYQQEWMDCEVKIQ